MYKDKVVPCFTRWSKCGGMTSNNLKKSIDHFNLLPRTNGVVLFAMLDGHESLFGLFFYSISMTLSLNEVYI